MSRQAGLSCLVQVGGLLDLGHDVGGEAAGKPGTAGREVFRVDRRGGRERVVPAVPADRFQEAAQPADVMDMAHLAAHFRLQDGQVAFQQRAGHAGQAGRRLGQAGEPGGEPGHGPGPGSGRASRQPSGQLPADIPLGQFPQPGLGDRREADGGLGLAGAQVAEPPDVPRVLGVPACAERERLDAAARVEDERTPAAPVSRRAEGGPPFLGLLQQGGRTRAGQDRNERVNFPGRQFRVLFVAAALQDVLHLQPEPGGQRPQVDVLLAGSRVLAGGRELIDIGTPVVLPAGVVAVTEHRRAADPQRAVADPAGRQRPAWRQRRSLCLPARQVRASRAIPPAEVPRAHPAAHRSVIAPGDDARIQWQVAVPAGLGRRGEFREGDPARPPPPLPVRGAQAPPAVRAVTAAHRARRPAEDRVPRVEDQVPGPELRAHRGHELFQQAGGSLVLPEPARFRGARVPGAAHRPSS